MFAESNCSPRRLALQLSHQLLRSRESWPRLQLDWQPEAVFCESCSCWSLSELLTSESCGVAPLAARCSGHNMDGVRREARGAATQHLTDATRGTILLTSPLTPRATLTVGCRSQLGQWSEQAALHSHSMLSAAVIAC